MTMGAFSPRRAPVLDRLIQLPGVITQGDDDRFGHPTFTEGPKRPHGQHAATQADAKPWSTAKAASPTWPSGSTPCATMPR